jgi:hypothetical protein
MGSYTAAAFPAWPLFRRIEAWRTPSPEAREAYGAKKPVAVDLLNVIYSKRADSFEFWLSLWHQPP